MSYNLDPVKEEEVKALLKTHSQREIVKITGVAKNTITRIRNENLTEEERVEFKKKANVRGRNKRKLNPEKEAIEVEETKKNCTKCLKDFPMTTEYFYPDKKAKDGLSWWCKECHKKGKKKHSMGKDHRFKGNKKRNYKDEYVRKKARMGIPKKIKSFPLAKATPEEIVKALRKGIAQEILQEIGDAFSKIRERWE